MDGVIYLERGGQSLHMHICFILNNFTQLPANSYKGITRVLDLWIYDLMLFTKTLWHYGKGEACIIMFGAQKKKEKEIRKKITLRGRARIQNRCSNTKITYPEFITYHP